MVTFKDAYERLGAAEGNLKRLDYAGAVREAQACVELSVKALFDFLQIKYDPKHDVPDKVFLEAFKIVAPKLKNYEAATFRNCLATARVYMRMLYCARRFAEFGFLDASAGELFGGEFAKVTVNRARKIYFCLSSIELRLTI